MNISFFNNSKYQILRWVGYRIEREFYFLREYTTLIDLIIKLYIIILIPSSILGACSIAIIGYLLQKLSTIKFQYTRTF